MWGEFAEVEDEEQWGWWRSGPLSDETAHWYPNGYSAVYEQTNLSQWRNGTGSDLLISDFWW